MARKTKTAKNSETSSPFSARGAAERLGADLHEPAKQEYPIVLQTPQITLPVKLTQDEIIIKCQDLAKTIQDKRREEEDQANQKQAMKARLSNLEDRVQKLAEVVDKKTEERPVDCVVQAHEDGMVTTTRLDTGECNDKRPINERERQLAMKQLSPPHEAAPAGDENEQE